MRYVHLLVPMALGFAGTADAVCPPDWVDGLREGGTHVVGAGVTLDDARADLCGSTRGVLVEATRELRVRLLPGGRVRRQFEKDLRTRCATYLPRHEVITHPDRERACTAVRLEQMPELKASIEFGGPSPAADEIEKAVRAALEVRLATVGYQVVDGASLMLRVESPHRGVGRRESGTGCYRPHVARLGADARVRIELDGRPWGEVSLRPARHGRGLSGRGRSRNDAVNHLFEVLLVFLERDRTLGRALAEAAR